MNNNRRMNAKEVYYTDEGDKVTVKLLHYPDVPPDQMHKLIFNEDGNISENQCERQLPEVPCNSYNSSEYETCTSQMTISTGSAYATAAGAPSYLCRRSSSYADDDDNDYEDYDYTTDESRCRRSVRKRSTASSVHHRKCSYAFAQAHSNSSDDVYESPTASTFIPLKSAYGCTDLIKHQTPPAIAPTPVIPPPPFIPSPPFIAPPPLIAPPPVIAPPQKQNNLNNLNKPNILNLNFDNLEKWNYFNTFGATPKAAPRPAPPVPKINIAPVAVYTPKSIAAPPVSAATAPLNATKPSAPITDNHCHICKRMIPNLTEAYSGKKHNSNAAETARNNINMINEQIMRNSVHNQLIEQQKDVALANWRSRSENPYSGTYPTNFNINYTMNSSSIKPESQQKMKSYNAANYTNTIMPTYRATGGGVTQPNMNTYCGTGGGITQPNMNAYRGSGDAANITYRNNDGAQVNITTFREFLLNKSAFENNRGYIKKDIFADGAFDNLEKMKKSDQHNPGGRSHSLNSNTAEKPKDRRQESRRRSSLGERFAESRGIAYGPSIQQERAQNSCQLKGTPQNLADQEEIPLHKCYFHRLDHGSNNFHANNTYVRESPRVSRARNVRENNVNRNKAKEAATERAAVKQSTPRQHIKPVIRCSSVTSTETIAAGAVKKRSSPHQPSLCPGYAQYSKSFLEVPLPRDYGYASSDDLSSEWDSDVPTPTTIQVKKPSGWRKIRNIVQWTPFFQTYKKQRYPWVQLAGHQGNFKAGPEQGTVLKKLCPKEENCFKLLMDDVLRPYIPDYKGQVNSEDAYLQLEDLLSGFNQPCVMDCKIGVRTYLEEELSKAKEKPKLRKDMYEKMIQIDPNAPTEEEHRAKGVTKPRYMVWRETISSTATLGFRIEGIKRSDGTSTKDFKTTKSRAQIKEAFQDFIVGFEQCVERYVHRLRVIRATLDCSEFFKSHEVIGSSLLFVHDEHKANIWLIDFAKTNMLPENHRINHNSAWKVGNHEDGYLIGINNLIEIFDELYREIKAKQAAAEASTSTLVDESKIENTDGTIKSTDAHNITKDLIANVSDGIMAAASPNSTEETVEIRRDFCRVLEDSYRRFRERSESEMEREREREREAEREREKQPERTAFERRTTYGRMRAQAREREKALALEHEQHQQERARRHSYDQPLESNSALLRNQIGGETFANTAIGGGDFADNSEQELPQKNYDEEARINLD